MRLKRRALLQRVSLALAALGVSQTGLSMLASRYQQALAQPTRRKLALLVGINQYPEQVCDCGSTRSSALSGCVTDVELQRELLIHRFGFQPDDILALTDQQATRDGIESAFLSHLTEQARPGDVVVFHFSGLGSRIKLTDTTEVERNSLVPIDGVLPTEENPAINDLMEDTLVLLLRSLPTEQVTTVLDLGYADLGRSLQGNLRLRSRPNAPTGLPNEAEVALQEQLMSRAKVSREQVRAQWRSGQLPGIVLAAAGPDQVAAEQQWNGFSAGLFTYALTQQLWWTTPSTTLRISLNRASSSVRQLAGSSQQPVLSGQKSQDPASPLYYTSPVPIQGADGVVTATEDDGKTLQIWLGGLPAPVLEYYGTNSLLALHPTELPGTEATAAPNAQPKEDAGSAASPGVQPLQVRSREGLTVKARLSSTEATPRSPQVGQLVCESVRYLPRNISLTVALDTSLERIERVDATSAFSAIPRVSSVIAGEQPADCLFGKAQPMRTLAASLATAALSKTRPSQTIASTRTLSGDLPSTKSSYGLFYLGRSAIPNTLVAEEEAVKTAVNRITPQLRTLLATKLIRLTENSGSSQLGIRATLEMLAPQERIILQQETVRGPWTPPESRLAVLFADNKVPTLPIGSRIQYRLNNYSDRPVYFILLGLDTSGNAIALYPASAIASSSAEEGSPIPADSIIPPGETLTVPQAKSNSDWIIQGPPGLIETHLIFSRSPLTQAFAALETAMRSKGDAHRVNLLLNPLEVAQAVLQDLHQASVAAGKTDVSADSYALNVSTWATLSFIYQAAAIS